MTTQEINSRLTSALKSFLRAEGHVESGDLYSSINITTDPQGNINIKGLEYLQYLDEGTFVDNFFNEQSTIDILEDYAALIIDEQL